MRKEKRWWIVVLRKEFRYSARRYSVNSRVIGSESYLLVSAPAAEEAYDKVVRYHEQPPECIDLVTKEKGRWHLVGICDLAPVFEPLEDNCELYFQELPSISRARLRRPIQRKSQLINFDWFGTARATKVKVKSRASQRVHHT
jgi:hypothetical protein